jgi:hypothetical protein
MAGIPLRFQRASGWVRQRPRLVRQGDAQSLCEMNMK